MNIGRYLEMYSEDLRLKNYAQNTIDNYLSQVRCFLNHFNSLVTKPSEINERQIKEWLLQGKTVNGIKHRMSAIKLFYHLTGGQNSKFKNIEYPRSEKKLPIVLSVEEVQKMFSVCENLKHKLILAILYSCGLRVSELIKLKWNDIDRSRMVINILGAKGNKDRQVPLPENLIPLLEKYWHEYKTKTFIFEGQFKDMYSSRSVLEVVKQLATKAGLKKDVWTHLIRHCYGTHQVESGVDINLIQRILGHSNVKTTNIYLHTSHNLISKIQSPLNQIVL